MWVGREDVLKLLGFAPEECATYHLLLPHTHDILGVDYRTPVVSDVHTFTAFVDWLADYFTQWMDRVDRLCARIHRFDWLAECFAQWIDR